VVLLAFITTLLVAANVGTILSANLVNHHPLVLLALSSRNRHLLLAVAAGIDPIPYGIVAFVRILAAAVPFFLLGRWYGDRALRWLDRQPGGTPSTIRWVERVFDRAADPLVFFMPASNLVCMLAGARSRPVTRFAALVAVGIMARLVFFWVLGKALEKPLDRVLAWIQRYQWWLAGAFLLVTIVQSTRRAAAVADDLPTEDVPDTEKG
jgi:membrane protein DedA with SNARE-associated domain